jgi:hypothetical protein
VPIWRYMDFTKYAWLLDRRSLFFSRADLLGDPFEGSYSRANVALRPEVYGEHASVMMPQIEAMHRALPRFTVVNCWHTNEVESAAMWRLYAISGAGIAIRSTFRRLTASFGPCPDAVYVGQVAYADYETDWIPEGITFHSFLHKRRSYEHEREIRAVRQKMPTNESNMIDLSLESYPDGGEAVPVDLPELIERVYVSPGAPTWLHELSRSVTRRFGLDVEVLQSGLDADPVY